MEFFYFKKDVEAAFIKMMEAGKLFIVNVDNDLLWMGYLLSFQEGEERQSHNCNACKSFIRHMGKTEYSDNQLSGLGFSSTQRNELVVKVDNKTFKIKF